MKRAFFSQSPDQIPLLISFDLDQPETCQLQTNAL